MTGGAPSWTFQSEDLVEAERLLGDFVRGSKARCALIVDRAGQVVTTVGDHAHLDLAAFASLAAADFSANDQLASMVGGSEPPSFFHQGREASLYLADVATCVILVVLFDTGTTPGMVRVKVKTLIPDLASTFQTLLDRPAPDAAQLEPGFSNEAEEQIDRLFADL